MIAQTKEWCGMQKIHQKQPSNLPTLLQPQNIKAVLDKMDAIPKKPGQAKLIKRKDIDD